MVIYSNKQLQIYTCKGDFMFKSGMLFITFMKRRFTKQLKLRFFLLGVATAIMNILILVLPLLQKKMIDSISDSYLDYKIIMLLLLIGIGIVIISIYEAIILNKLFYININHPIQYHNFIHHNKMDLDICHCNHTHLSYYVHHTLHN